MTNTKDKALEEL